MSSPLPHKPHARRRTRGESLSISTSTDPSTPSHSPSSAVALHSAHSATRKTEEAEDSSTESVEMNTLSSGDSDEETGLTAASRERRRIKKKRRRGFSGLGAEGGRMRDSQAAGGDVHTPGEGERVINGIAVTSAERKLADLNVLKSMAVNGVLIGLW